MSVTLVQLATGLGAGVVIGLVLTLLGAGGSMLATPLLLYGVRLPDPHVAIGTSACAVASSAVMGAYHHARAGSVRWPVLRPFILGGSGGAVLGTMVAKTVSANGLLILFAMLVAWVGARMWPARPEPAGRSRRSAVPGRVAASGFAVGSLSGFFGVGGGFLCVPALLGTTDLSMDEAVGSSLVAIAAFAFSSTVSYAVSGLINWPLAIALVAGGAAGTRVAGWFRRSVCTNDLVLRRTFGLILLCVATTMVRTAL